MKVQIEIELDNDAFNGNLLGELRRILLTVPTKVKAQLQRPASICQAPEASDKLLDINGNTIGKITLIL